MNQLSTVKDTTRQRPELPSFVTARGAYQTLSDDLRHDVKAEKLLEVLSAFITDLYRFDELKQPLYVDPVDYRILVRVPWAKKWTSPEPAALRKTERDALRAIISDAQRSAKTMPLFIYDQPHYYLSAGDYKDLRTALRWVEQLGINGALYRKFDAARRAKRRATV